MEEGSGGTIVLYQLLLRNFPKGAAQHALWQTTFCHSLIHSSMAVSKDILSEYISHTVVAECVSTIMCHYYAWVNDWLPYLEVSSLWFRWHPVICGNYMLLHSLVTHELLAGEIYAPCEPCVLCISACIYAYKLSHFITLSFYHTISVPSGGSYAPGVYKSTLGRWSFTLHWSHSSKEPDTISVCVSPIHWHLWQDHL